MLNAPALALAALAVMTSSTYAAPAKKRVAPSPSPSPVAAVSPEACDGRAIRMRDGSCESVDYAPTRKADFTDPALVDGETVKPSLGDITAKPSTQFDCPIEKFPTLEAWQACKGIKPEQKALSAEVSEAIYSRRECPSTLSDIEEIKQLIQGKQPGNPKNTLAALEAYPLDPAGTRQEPHLSTSCGYNSPRWYKVSTHSKGHRYFHQGLEALPLSCFELAPNSEGTFELVGASCEGSTSNRRGGVIGFTSHYSLSSDLRIETVGNKPNGSDVFYFGLILTPSRAGYYAEACRKVLSLKKNEDLFTPSEKITFMRSIQLLMLKGDTLDRVKHLTKKLATDSIDLPSSIVSRLRSEVEGHFQTLELPIDPVPSSLDLRKYEGVDACNAYAELVK